MYCNLIFIDPFVIILMKIIYYINSKKPNPTDESKFTRRATLILYKGSSLRIIASNLYSLITSKGDLAKESKADQM